VAATRAPGCVTAGAPFAVRTSRLPLVRHSAITGKRRRLDALVWSPPLSRCARPLIVFSHGHHGDPASCARLCASLARAGFLVVAPHHLDVAAGIGEQAVERADDVMWVLDHLRLRHDRRRVAVAGHSFGGNTAAAVGSQVPRVRAVLSMAGTADHGTMAATTAPTLIVAGTRDSIETVQNSRTAAAAIPRDVPHELLVVPGARHGELLQRDVVMRAATRFFLTYLAGGRPAGTGRSGA
jgi:dienelactone hydrolase